MSSDAVTWMGCVQAEILISDLIGGDCGRYEAFLTLLKFAKAGLVRINATKFGMTYINADVPEGERDFLNSVVIGSVDGDMLIDGIGRLYAHGIGEGEF